MSSILLNGHATVPRVPLLGSGVGGLDPQPQSGEPVLVSARRVVSSIAALPDPQMTEKAKRRRFSAAYKRSVIEEADECVGRGELGALLRREGLYASTLSNFRRQEADGLLEPGMTRKPRATKDLALQASLVQRAEIERENRQLRRKLAHAEKIIAIQKKAAILLGETLQDMNLDEID